MAVHLVDELSSDIRLTPAQTAEGLFIGHVVGVRTPAVIRMLPDVVPDILRIAGADVRIAAQIQPVQLGCTVAQLYTELILAAEAVKSLNQHPLIDKKRQGFEISAVDFRLIQKWLQAWRQIPEHKILYLLKGLAVAVNISLFVLKGGILQCAEPVGEFQCGAERQRLFFNADPHG
ncbi:hypothetical protein D3C75_758070 [compost metagenome]